jgi:hypothetical protein
MAQWLNYRLTPRNKRNKQYLNNSSGVKPLHRTLKQSETFSQASFAG